MKQIKNYKIIFVALFIILLAGCTSNSELNYEIAYITVTPNTLFTDSLDTTFAEVIIKVEDSEGSPVPSIIVIFETDLGYIDNTTVTDESGIASNYFHDDGNIGIAHITAFICGKKNQPVTISVEIFPNSYQITSIDVNPRLLYADNIPDTYSEITVTVIDSEGFPATGKAVNFETDLGYLQNMVYTTQTGTATSSYFDNGIPGTAHITARIGDSVATDSIEIFQSPYFIIDSVYISNPVIYADNGLSYSNIEVWIKDQDGLAAIEEDVWFQANMGNIITHVSTDSIGIALSTFWANDEPGTAYITAYCGLSDSTFTIEIEPI